jgi:hypothetical protein
MREATQEPLSEAIRWLADWVRLIEDQRGQPCPPEWLDYTNSLAREIALRLQFGIADRK